MSQLRNQYNARAHEHDCGRNRTPVYITGELSRKVSETVKEKIVYKLFIIDSAAGEIIGVKHFVPHSLQRC